jgi:hypothetical protein
MTPLPKTSCADHGEPYPVALDLSVGDRRVSRPVRGVDRAGQASPSAFKSKKISDTILGRSPKSPVNSALQTPSTL